MATQSAAEAVAAVQAAAAASVDPAEVHARVDFEQAIKRAQGNHASFSTLDFRGVQLTLKPEWVGQLGEALKANDTCATLCLAECGLTDGALQLLAATLFVPSRCPKLRVLDLRDNPALTKVGETVAQGLARMRPGLDVRLGEGLDIAAEGFVHDKQLVEKLTAWPFHTLAVPGGGMQDAYCPEEISGKGKPRIELKRGFQGPNGTKYRCDLAIFEMYHSTGNLVLLELLGEAKPESEGVVV